jgi:hypothetical protein
MYRLHKCTRYVLRRQKPTVIKDVYGITVGWNGVQVQQTKESVVLHGWHITEEVTWIEQQNTQEQQIKRHNPYLLYEGVSKSFLTGRPERELQMVQLSATRYNCIVIL